MAGVLKLKRMWLSFHLYTRPLFFLWYYLKSLAYPPLMAIILLIAQLLDLANEQFSGPPIVSSDQENSLPDLLFQKKDFLSLFLKLFLTSIRFEAAK